MSSLLNNLRQAEGFLQESKCYDCNMSFEQQMDLTRCLAYVSDLIECIEKTGNDSKFRVPTIEESKEAHEHLIEVTMAANELYKEYLERQAYYEF